MGRPVATIDYRHALEAPFPAQLHDAKADYLAQALHSESG